MFAVTITFTIERGHMPEFLPLMHLNAQMSLADEPDCRQFDVCTDPSHPNEVFLYEVYSDAAAFQTHLGSAHFKEFDAAVADMIATKEVRIFGEVTQ